jgi:hypothetical protein
MPLPLVALPEISELSGTTKYMTLDMDVAEIQNFR